MPGSKSSSVSLHEDGINDTSGLSEINISDEKGSAGKRTMALIEKNGYQDSIYINAAKVFQGIRTEKRKDRTLVRYGGDSVSPLLPFKDEYSQRVSYELAFSALKYQDLLEEILLDSCVYPCYSIPDDLTSLLVVMLYDLQDRKFQTREIFDEEEPIAEVQTVERYLYSSRIKLAAALARCRIKHDAASIEYILPETIRKQEQRASALPLCVWINTLKISLEDVFKDLKKKGFTRVETLSDLHPYTYCMDQHCHDVLLFPSSHKEELMNLDLFADCKLLLQDKSRSLAVHSAQALLSTGGDVLVAHIGSHLTIVHMSALTAHSGSRIFVCGMKSSAKEAELRDLFSHMGCKDIVLLNEDFTDIGPTDPRLTKAEVIVLLPQCSGLGAGSPIDFILNEHRDTGLLRDLFRGCVSEDKLSILAERQLKELRHAMTFNVQAIVYCTCSVYPEENELVVKKALESGAGDKLQRYRVIPPVFSACSNPEAPTDVFFKTEPSEMSSGCFLAVLAREEDSSKNMSFKDILGRAAAKGLLEDIFGEKSKEEEKKHPNVGEKSKKEEKKRPKVTQRSSKTPARGTEPKIADFLRHQTVPSSKAAVPVPKPVSKTQQKNVVQPHSYAQKKKPIKPIAGAAPPSAPKCTPRPLPTGRPALAGKPRVERKRLVLKCIEIVFPPVVTQRNKPGTTPYSGFRGWAGTKGSSRRILPPPLSKAVKPAVLGHPQPWL
ncbi:putative methyltransferase NSUN7 [Porphyrio hochstetteri]